MYNMFDRDHDGKLNASEKAEEAYFYFEILNKDEKNGDNHPVSRPQNNNAGIKVIGLSC